ncbi:MAG: transporter [bacterium]
METESARLQNSGWMKVGSAYEIQTSDQGKEYAVPFVFEYGITDRFEIVVEPILFSSIKPNSGSTAKGLGDLEMTLSYLLFKEKKSFPAIALAAEVKIPTANNKLIGTGKTDYAFYLIGSKKFGNLDLNANINYTYIGKPTGSSLQNIFFFASSFKYEIKNKILLFGELYGNTPSTNIPEGSGMGGEGTLTPEAAGGEIVGSLGVGYYVVPKLLLSFSTSYDNNNAFLFRPAISLETNLFGHNKMKK